jgi:hypothetical protein
MPDLLTAATSCKNKQKSAQISGSWDNFGTEVP